jgi:hypothetical protein
VAPGDTRRFVPAVVRSTASRSVTIAVFPGGTVYSVVVLVPVIACETKRTE